MSGEENKKIENRWCRSAVCGAEPFIPDSEYDGEECELTCNIQKEEQ
tara:strand:+ start:239 stop:379 length:141 start_codon:yes stop_codon:yes gene_type:complete